MSVRWALKIVYRLITFRIRTVVLLMAVAILGGFLTNSASMTYVNAREAYLAGLLSERGDGASSVVQAPDSAREGLNGLSRSAAVSTSNANLAFGDAQTPVTVWAISEPGYPFQYVEAGRRPEAAGEIAVSREVQRSLGLSLGDQATVLGDRTDYRGTIVGITVNPGAPGASSMQEFDEQKAGADPTYWILSPDAMAELQQDSQLGELFQRGELSVNSNATVLIEGAQQLPSQIALVRVFAVSAGLTYLLVTIFVLWSLARPAGRDVASLTASGMSEEAAWRVMSVTASVVMTLSALVGIVISGLSVDVLSSRVALALGTDWLSLGWSWTPVLLVLWASAVCPALLRLGTRLVHSLQHARPARSPAQEAMMKRTGATACALGLILSAVALLVPWGTGSSVFSMAAGLAAIGTGLYLWVGLIASGRRPAGARQIAREIVMRRSGFVGCAFLVASLGAGYAALTTHDATAVATGAGGQNQLQPHGSLLALQVPEDAVQDLVRNYEARGGTDSRVYGLPVATRGDIRALATGDGSSGGMLVYVGFDAELGHDDVVAQPDAVVDGVVEIARVTESGTEQAGRFAARTDEHLGGNMPGVLISPDGAIARDLEMTHSGFSEIAFLDFDALTSQDSATMYGDLGRLAPSAILSASEAVDPLTKDVAIARLVSGGAAMLAGFVIIAGSVVISLSYRHFRMTLHDLGAGRRFRLKLLQTTTIAEVTAGAAILGGFILATERLSTVPWEGTIGFAWTLPIIAVTTLGIADTARLVLSSPAR